MKLLWNILGFFLSVALLSGTIVTVFFFLGRAGEEATRAAQRASHPLAYPELVDKAAADYDVPRAVIYAVMRTESGFSADAVSRAGARGLMQLMPATYEWLCALRGQDYAPDALFDPAVNIDAGVYLLAYLYRQLSDWEAVYAAYNAGIGRVKGWLSDPAYAKDGHLSEIPIAETAEYVKRCRTARYHYIHLWGI